MIGECEIGHREPLKIEQRPHEGVCVIDGTPYSYELLRGGFCHGIGPRWFRVIGRRRGGEVVVSAAVLPRWLSWICSKVAKIR